MFDKERYVITGGPGLGKSSLLSALEQLGFAVCAESARIIIDGWRRAGSPFPSPWTDRATFDSEIEKLMLSAYFRDVSGPIVFDRGLPDLIAWRSYLGQPRDSRLEALITAHPYSSPIFLTPKWAPWYRSDDDRPFSRNKSFALNDSIESTYRSLGYDVVELPKVDVDGRAAFFASYMTSRNHFR